MNKHKLYIALISAYDPCKFMRILILIIKNRVIMLEGNRTEINLNAF